MIRNLHLSAGSVTKNSSRILKESNSLINQKLVDEVFILGVIQDSTFTNHFQIGSQIFIKNIKPVFQFANKSVVSEGIKYISLIFKIIKETSKQQFSLINVHSIHMLPIGIILKYIKGAKLIYDAHELETEVVGAHGLKKKFAQILERFFLRFIDYTIVVSQSIKQWYQNKYNLEKIVVIRNAPLLSHNIPKNDSLLKKLLRIPKNEILFIYQGYISEDRGCDKILEVFKKMPRSYHIVFMGNGPLKIKIKELSIKFLNIHYKSAVPMDEIGNYTSSADLGLHFIPVQNVLNHKYCLPNKFFEYIHSGLPVISNSKAIEMSRIINRYNIGTSVDTDKFDLSEIRKILQNIGAADINQYKKNTIIVKEKINWLNEAKGYNKVFSALSIK